MQLEGRVSKLLPIRSGVSANSGEKWTVLEFLFEYFENPSDLYPRRCMLSVRGEDKIKDLNLQVDDTIRVRIALSCREYEGRYFNDIRTGLIEIVRRNGAPVTTSAAPQTAEASPEPQINPKTAQQATQEAKVGETDDLPF